MTDELHVTLGGDLAGKLTRASGGKLRFEYQEEYRQRPESTPLSLSMPLRVCSHTNETVTPWIWGLLPDSEAVLRRWAREFQVSATSPFALLGTEIGQDCAGAVRFTPPEPAKQSIEPTGGVAWLSDAEVADRLAALREDSTAWLGRDFTGQFSLAGAQAKTALLLRDGRWGAPSGATPTTHILKPAIGGLDDHDLNEHLCLDAARRAGLIAAPTAISRFGEETAVVVTRYDRHEAPDGQITRIHQEDLCQALAVAPSQKYQSSGGPTPSEMVALLRRAMPTGDAENAVTRFADALIWNWLIGGTDAHAKNYSLLLSGGQVRLAPLYDIASALPYGRHERKLRFAMKIGDDYRVYTHRNPWPTAARELGLDQEMLHDRAASLAEITPSAFADAARAPAVSDLKSALPYTLTDRIADRAGRCLEVLRKATG